jgi:hypothetical protein
VTAEMEGTGRTGGPITGWVIEYDGSLDAAGSWQNVLNAAALNPNEAETTSTAADVAREMLEVDGRESTAAVLAAQVMEQRFEELDNQGKQRRRLEFQEQIRQEFLVVAEEVSGGTPGDSVVVVVENLAAGVTSAMLVGTFRQVGSVLDAGMESSEDWGWVRFELAEQAVEAVMSFGGIELAGQPMVCRLQDREQVGGWAEGDGADY